MKDILLVDDEPHVIRVLRMSLEGAGYSVRHATNGVQALERIREAQPDLLITDIDMPGMTGKDLCRAIIREIPDRSFAIYVLTSRAENEHREWSRELENLLFIEKPVSIRQLLVDLKRDLASKRDPERTWKIAR
jgi:CheY-like chemotaxis protein